MIRKVGAFQPPPLFFSGVRVTRSLVLYVCFVDRCLSFFFWTLCCLSLDMRILITSLISSNSSTDGNFGLDSMSILFQWQSICRLIPPSFLYFLYAKYCCICSLLNVHEIFVVKRQTTNNQSIIKLYFSVKPPMDFKLNLARITLQDGHHPRT